MKCPNCGQPTDAIRTGSERYRLRWCSFCGTLTETRIINSPGAMSAKALEAGAVEEEQGPVASVPRLVERCRAFAGGLVREPRPEHTGAEIFNGLASTWKSLGIDRLINPTTPAP